VAKNELAEFGWTFRRTSSSWIFLPARNFAPPFHTPRFYASVEFEF